MKVELASSTIQGRSRRRRSVIVYPSAERSLPTPAADGAGGTAARMLRLAMPPASTQSRRIRGSPVRGEQPKNTFYFNCSLFVYQNIRSTPTPFHSTFYSG